MIHNADGTRTDPTTGLVVNNELQLESSHMNRMRDWFDKPGDRATEAKEYKQANLNQFDGLYHNPDGTLVDPNTGTLVENPQTLV